ncbi:MAG: hypothetical protein KIT84_00290 [Labilithrix sp.]|nr:hypothetical protein [Labilithrix sp.]MCW5809421.1 hypothetical protein [Labilithrix sp.]
MKRHVLVLLLGACATPPPVAPPPPPPAAAPVAAVEEVVEDAGAPVVEPPPVYPSAPDDTDAVILQRTACQGRCPIYSVGITSNGNVHFFGELFTKKLGYAFATVPREEVAALYKRVDALRPAPSKHPAAPDRPSAFVVRRRKGVTTRLDAPGTIFEEIDSVANTKAWVASDQTSGYDRGDPIPAAAAQAMLGRQLEALDKCAGGKTEIEITIESTELGQARIANVAGKKEPDDCVRKAVAALRFPLGAAPVAPLTVTIGK